MRLLKAASLAAWVSAGACQASEEVYVDQFQQVLGGQRDSTEPHRGPAESHDRSFGQLPPPDHDGYDLHGNFKHALQCMQDSYFQLWAGTWPNAIDWTAAVVNTHVVSALLTFTRMREIRDLRQSEPDQYAGSDTRELLEDLHAEEDLISRYFMHSTAFYFGENAFALRNQAYDDMLWVVLDWLENIRFTKEHGDLHSLNRSGPWYGSEYTTAFAHRARIFYDLASRGWDTTLCGGGMLWNRNLDPYKNAITNQLYIAASIGMYLYFPGDLIDSPYLATSDSSQEHSLASSFDHTRTRYLDNAIKAHAWLKQSNMTNVASLYVDGYHVTGWRRHRSNGTAECDDRNEMVYTYNQGVILSGLRGLFEATGNVSYLLEGHELAYAVAKATGYDGSPGGNHDYRWSGLGRGGVIEDYCDHTGRCNQDAQAFKGIFFMHLARFCEVPNDYQRRSEHVEPGYHTAMKEHLVACLRLRGWVLHNAEAALRTRDEHGKFGMWWNAHLVQDRPAGLEVDVRLPEGAVDYRNDYTLTETDAWTGLDGSRGEPLVRNQQREEHDLPVTFKRAGDLNDRGRGRTVETQTGGLAVVRAAYQISQISEALKPFGNEL